MVATANRRTGISRVDVLCLIAIAVLLSSLLIPAVPHLRESSRQQQCRSRLRHLGTALLSYHDRHQSFPPAATWGGEGLDLAKLGSHEEPTPVHVTRQNWIQFLLPDLDRASLALQIQPGLPMADERNRTARTTQIVELSCPSDSFNRPDNPYRMPLPDGSSADFARGNYAINGGSEFVPAAFGTLANPGPTHSQYAYDLDSGTYSFLGSGIAGINRCVSLKDFRNGLSTMVALEEVRAGLSPIDTRGVWSLGQIGGSITWAHGVTGDDGAPNATELNTGADDIRSGKQLYAELGRPFIDGERMQACDHCDENVQATARSKHPGGVHVLTLDGAVHFVSDNVEPTVWHVMHSRGTPKELLENRLSEEFQGWDAKAAMRGAARAPGPNSVSDLLPESLRNSIEMEFTRIPAGEFTMGIEDANFRLAFPTDAVPHQVRISKDFLMGTHEVTQRQYEAVMATNPSWHTVASAGAETVKTTDTSNWPVENVSWDDAVTFCRRLSELPGERAARRSYRLPTEAEWEYSCRGGQAGKIRRPTWEDALKTGEYGSNKPPSSATLLPGQIGVYPPNGFGVYDMCGSVFEWTADYRRRDVYANSPVNDPAGPPTGYLRVIRGWHWVATGPNCRVYVANEPWVGSRFIGFRVVCMQD